MKCVEVSVSVSNDEIVSTRFVISVSSKPSRSVDGRLDNSMGENFVFVGCQMLRVVELKEGIAIDSTITDLNS